MPATPYVYERQVEYWTSREIENFFLDSGFEIVVFPLTGLIEKQLPSDFLFFDKGLTKIFGFQFKALYKNKHDHWRLNPQQHEQLKTFDWMYYALSDITSSLQHRTALHYLRIAPSSFEFTENLTRSSLPQLGDARYVRWAAFFEGLRKCKYGKKIRHQDDLWRAVWPNRADIPREIRGIADEVFLADFQEKRAVRYSSLIEL
jgi:hypothetical protein